MKKTIAILLVLVIGMVGVWAATSDAQASPVQSSQITVNTTVSEFALFGITAASVDEANFATKALFEAAVGTTLTKSVAMLDLVNAVEVGKLSGINNTAAGVTLYITSTALTSGTNSVALTVSPATATIPASSGNAFGTLKNTAITVKEATAGKAALAPAGSYTATVTINITNPA